MNAVKAWAVSLVAMMVLMGFMPVVSAQSTTSHAPVAQSVEVRYDPDPSINWNDTINIANSSDHWKLNYNQTIAPFLDNNTDIKGIVVAPYFSPVVLNKTVDHKDISIAQYFKVRPEIVIDGVSEFWVKIPVMNIPDNASIQVRVGRIDTSQNTFNLSYSAFGTPSFVGNVVKILDITDNSLSDYQDFRRDQSNRYNATTNFYWNFTWVRCAFALMPNEFYVMMFDIAFVGNGAGHTSLVIAQDDLWADSLYKSWVWVNGTSYFFPGDLDMSMVLTTGMANGITGISVDQKDDTSAAAVLHYNASIPVHQVASLQFLEMVFPVLYLKKVSVQLNLSVIVTVYSSANDSVPIYVNSITYQFDATVNIALLDFDISAIGGATMDHIRLDISAPTYSAMDLRLWGYEYYNAGSGFMLTQGFTDIYWVSALNGFTNVTKAFFIPFGSIIQSSTQWTYTDLPLIFIPTQEPNSTANISLAIHNFEIYLMGDAANKKMTAALIDTIIQTCISLWNIATSLGDTPLFKWIIIPLIKWAWQAFIDAADPAKGNIFGAAIWFFTMLTLAIDALQYMAYFSVRAIYAFSLIIIYIINIYGVISINAALFAYATTGRMSDFTRSFRAGWKFVYGIIALLLSLIIIAVSILGAVIPL